MTKFLGHTVRDTVSGITGIADQFVEFLSGTIQYAVQPKGDGATMPAGFAIDATQLELVTGRKASSVPATTPERTYIGLGDEVEDIVTGLVGIANRKMTFINGCIYFDVIEHSSKIAGRDPSTLFVTQSRLKILTKQKFQTVQASVEAANSRLTAATMTKPEPDEAAAPTKPRTGGPSSRSMRM